MESPKCACQVWMKNWLKKRIIFNGHEYEIARVIIIFGCIFCDAFNAFMFWSCPKTLEQKKHMTDRGWWKNDVVFAYLNWGWWMSMVWWTFRWEYDKLVAFMCLTRKKKVWYLNRVCFNGWVVDVDGKILSLRISLNIPDFDGKKYIILLNENGSFWSQIWGVPNVQL